MFTPFLIMGRLMFVHHMFAYSVKFIILSSQQWTSYGSWREKDIIKREDKLQTA
jgi:hypothetical protein